MKFSIKQFLGFVALVGVTTCTAVTFANSAASKKPDTRGNLKELGSALMAYAQDYDEVLPPMKDAASFQELLCCYLKDKSVFISPETGKPFVANPSLSGRSLDSLYKEGYEKKQGVVAFYEASPQKSGARFVLRMAKPFKYIDDDPVWEYSGKNDTFWEPTVERLSQSQWLETKKAFNLP